MGPLKRAGGGVTPYELWLDDSKYVAGDFDDLKKLLIQLTIICSLKNWITMVLEGLQKASSCPHEGEETICSNSE